MMLRLLKSNRPVNFILFPLFGVLFWLPGLLEPEPYPFYEGETQNLLYKPIGEMVENAPFIQGLIALGVLILLAFLMLQVNNRYSFIRIRTMLPAPLFIIMVSGFTVLHTLHPVYFAATFFLIAIFRFFSAFDKVKPYTAVFDSGILLGIASLFYFNMVVLFPAFFFGIRILARETRWREYVIFLTGFLLPFGFAFAYAFWFGQVPQLWNTFEQNMLTPNSHFRDNLFLQIFLGLLVFLTFLGSITLINQYDSKKVSTRKFFTVFFLFFICSLGSFLFVPATSQEMLVIIAIPVTFQVSNFFVFMKSRFWSELFFYLLFGAVIVLQLIA